MYFVTGNKTKFHEIQKILPEILQLDLEVPEIQDLDAHQVIRAKIEAALQLKKKPLFVEDTSIYIEGLNGLPGPLVKWFVKSLGFKGLFELAEKSGNANVKAICIIGYADTNGVQFFESTLEGTLVPPRGKGDNGWDEIFLPRDSILTVAEMSEMERSSIHPRVLAAQKLRAYLLNEHE